MLLKAYSGHKLNILSQVNRRLVHRSHTVDAPVLVQAGENHDLLLGTDLQTKLGFVLVSEEGAKFVDLLTGKDNNLARQSPGLAERAAVNTTGNTPQAGSGDAETVRQTHNHKPGVEGEMPFSVHPEVDESSRLATNTST